MEKYKVIKRLLKQGFTKQQISSVDLRDADLMNADLRNTNLRNANLRDADLSYANLDFSCLPLWCGGQFKADKRITKQLVAHTLRIMELTDDDDIKLKKDMAKFCKGWHNENEF